MSLTVLLGADKFQKFTVLSNNVLNRLRGCRLGRLEKSGPGYSPHVYGLVNVCSILYLCQKNTPPIRRHIPANNVKSFEWNQRQR